MRLISSRAAIAGFDADTVGKRRTEAL